MSSGQGIKVKILVMALGHAFLITGCGAGTGGGDSRTNQYGTWFWGGSSWTRLAPASQDKAFYADQLVYSAALGGLININGTKWSGSGWVRNEAGPTPPPGKYLYPFQPTALVLDEARDQLLFFDPAEHAMLGWSAGNWIPLVSPEIWPQIGSLGFGGVGYDLDRRVILMLTFRNLELETLAWNGHSFDVLASHSGLPLSEFLIVHDSRGQMLAFGQDSVGGPTSSFSWDGNAWSPLGPAAKLPPQVDSVAYDTTRQELIAVGSGYDGIFHTWRWQNGSWRPVQSSPSPSTGRVSNLVYDPELKGLVVTVLPSIGVGGMI
jgi:hypothetical protein